MAPKTKYDPIRIADEPLMLRYDIMTIAPDLVIPTLCGDDTLGNYESLQIHKRMRFLRAARVRYRPIACRPH